MVARNLAFPLDEMYEGALSGGVRAIPVYHMRAYETGAGEYVRWEQDFEPDPFGWGPNAPAGTLTDIVTELITERIVDTNKEPEFLWAWNGRDLSQFELVSGNGVGGVGAPGDWTLAVGTFPNDSAPALNITNVTANSTTAIWLFRDYTAPPPRRMQVAWRHLLNATGVMDVGLITYYEDATHWFAVQSTFVQDIGILTSNGASGLSGQIIGETADTAGNRDTTYGDVRAATVLQSFASGSAAPWYVGAAGGETQHSYIETGSDYRRTKAFTQASQNADWLSIGSYAPRIGFFVRGFGTAGTDDVGGMVMRSAYGGV